MLPRLFDVFGWPFSSYFVFVAVAYTVAIVLAIRWADRHEVDSRLLVDLGLFSVAVGVLGARLAHVLLDGHFADYVKLCIEPAAVGRRITEARCRWEGGVWDGAAALCRPGEADCLAWAKFWSGGLTLYGGLMTTVVFGIWFLRRARAPAMKVLDGCAPAVLLGLGLGRIGCFLSGCCFGIQTTAGLGVRFPSWSPASVAQWRAAELADPSLLSHPVHPTQLYEALGAWIVAGGLMLWGPRRKRGHGDVAAIGLAGYASVRFGIEFLRADPRGQLLGMPPSQTLGVVAVAVALTGILIVRRSASKPMAHAGVA